MPPNAEATATSTNHSQLPAIDNGETQTPELPIAARLKGPGPAAYTLPSTIGPSKIIRQAPMFSFGSRLRDFNVNNTPGPNAFFPVNTRTGNIGGPCFSLSGRHKPDLVGKEVFTETPFGLQEAYMLMNSASETPGPGGLPAPHLYKESHPPAFTISGKRPDGKPEKVPGPAEYSIPASIGPKQALFRSSPAYTMSGPRKAKLLSFSPGPAAYSSLEPGKIKKAAPAYSLGSRTFNHLLDGDRPAPQPGPGSYTPKSHGTDPHGFSFRIKHSEYEMFVPDLIQDEQVV